MLEDFSTQFSSALPAYEIFGDYFQTLYRLPTSDF